jgi:hypothetical protein
MPKLETTILFQFLFIFWFFNPCLPIGYLNIFYDVFEDISLCNCLVSALGVWGEGRRERERETYFSVSHYIFDSPICNIITLNIFCTFKTTLGIYNFCFS